MAHENEHTDAVIAVDPGGLAHGEEVAERLGHLAVIHIDKAVVHPVVDEFAAVRGFRLGDFVFVVRKRKVAAAAVNVDRLAEIAVGHGRAFDMPAGTARAPGRIPARLAGLRGLPERKVQRVFLHIVHIDARAGLKILDRLVGELAVSGKFERAVVHIAVDLVSIALFDQRLDDLNDLTDVFGRFGVHRRRTDTERRHVLPVLCNVFLRDLVGGDTLLVRALDDLVVHIGEVLHERDLVPAIFKIPAQHVKNHDGAGVAHMDVVVDRRPAGVHFYLSRFNGLELLQLHVHIVEYFHCISSPTGDKL